MGFLLVLLGALGFSVGFVLLILGLIKKKKMKGGLVLGISLVVFIIGFIMVPKAETESADDSKDNAKVETSSKAKEDSNKSTPEEAPSKDDELKKQKEYFVNNTQPAIDEWNKTFDKIWAEGWQPTFEAIGNGSRDVYTAYDNMKNVKESYKTLSMNKSIPVEGLSKEHQEAVEEAMKNLAYAALSREMAAKKAMKMFDENDFSPSTMDKMKSDVSASDTYLLDGVVKITTIKSDLGLIEEVKK